MRRGITVVAVLVLAQCAVVVGLSGVASAQPPLTGSTNCAIANGMVRFVQGLTPTAVNGNEQVDVSGAMNCTAGNVASPTITSLTGVIKGVLVFKHSPAPNKARKCSNFEGLLPADHLVGTSKLVVSWNAMNGSVPVPVASTTVLYSGLYSAVVTGTTMTLETGNAPGGPSTTTTTTGSFAASTNQLVKAILTVPLGGCPVATSPFNVPPNTAGAEF